MCFGNTVQTGENRGFQSSNTSNTYDPWVTAAGRGIFGNAAGYDANNPFRPYGGPVSAAFGPEFGQASAFLGSELGRTNPYTTAAGGFAANLAGAINPNASVNSYMSPYLKATLAPTLGNIQDEADRASLRNNAAATSAGSYGGTASGVAQALLDKYTQQNIQGATGQVYNNAYQNANQTRQGLLNTMLGASNTLGGVGQQAFGQGTTLASLLAGLGSQEQRAGQEGIQNAINLNTSNQREPLNRYALLAQILRGIPLNSTSNTIGYNIGQQFAPDNSGFSLLGSLL